MKNKIYLKKYLIITLIPIIIFIIIFTTLNIYEYQTYNQNFNKTVSSIILKLKEEYPNLSEEEIIKILNAKKYDKNILLKYNIDFQNSYILTNKTQSQKFLILNLSFLIISFLILILIFLLYNYKKDSKIKEITNYIVELNKKNYSLKIDDISEDELSILKNEIYKTTVMLKEIADNTNKDKYELKKSLEDISHQIKTPLTSILIMLDNLIDNPNMPNTTKEEFIRDIKREVINIKFLIENILKLSKFDVNAIKFHKTTNKLETILNDSIKNISNLCDLKNIKINLKGNSKIIINCDYHWQVEAITNILKNCIEHSKNNKEININYEQNKVYIKITIKDQGIGISQKDLPHIFERFYKGENASKDSIGIGLSLSKAIIEQDNGNISVTSNKNGTTFTIKYFNI